MSTPVSLSRRLRLQALGFADLFAILPGITARAIGPELRLIVPTANGDNKFYRLPIDLPP